MHKNLTGSLHKEQSRTPRLLPATTPGSRAWIAKPLRRSVSRWSLGQYKTFTALISATHGHPGGQSHLDAEQKMICRDACSLLFHTQDVLRSLCKHEMSSQGKPIF